VQFLRFFWKATPDSRESAGAKCKILRAVNFTETLDVFDFCTEELQSVLRTARHRQRDNVSSELAAAGSSEANSTYPPAAATNESTGFPETFTGQYELCGVVTHQGRSADSGHYMSYVRNAKNNNWIKFDDDKVSEARLEEVLRLSGGGDRDMAYFCFYRMKF
jgi:ubiquitin carboxyl-terminal hydrolase 14